MVNIITPQELANLDRDILDTGKAVNTKAIITPRFGPAFKSLPLAVEEGEQKIEAVKIKLQTDANNLVAQGFYAGYETEALLLMDRPDVAEMRARADDTRKIWRWTRTSAEGAMPVGTWVDTGQSELDQAINYADEQKIQKFIGFNRKDVLYEVTDANGNQTWLQVSSEDGKPTLFAKNAIQESVNLNLNNLVISIGEKLLYSLQDKQGNATALSIRESDGMFAQFVIDNIAERLNLAPPDLAELQYRPNPSDFQILSSIARGIARHAEARPLPSQITDAVNSTGQNIRLTFPNSYSDATPLILVICFEGIGDPSLDIRGAYSGVLNHGVVWAKCSFHGNSYGSPAAMQDAKDVYQKVCEIAPIGGVVIAGNSMGGAAAFNALTTEAVPNIIGLHLTDPVFSLRHRYDNGRASDINAAYDCTAETYDEKTNGYDPDLQHWSKFKGVPIKVIATSNDTAVPMAFHTNKMAEKLNLHNDVQVIDTLAPNHNSAEQFNVTELIAFINKCASGAVITTV